MRCDGDGATAKQTSGQESGLLAVESWADVSSSHCPSVETGEDGEVEEGRRWTAVQQQTRSLPTGSHGGLIAGPLGRIDRDESGQFQDCHGISAIRNAPHVATRHCLRRPALIGQCRVSPCAASGAAFFADRRSDVRLPPALHSVAAFGAVLASRRRRVCPRHKRRERGGRNDTEIKAKTGLYAAGMLPCLRNEPTSHPNGVPGAPVRAASCACSL